MNAKISYVYYKLTVNCSYLAKCRKKKCIVQTKKWSDMPLLFNKSSTFYMLCFMFQILPRHVRHKFIFKFLNTTKVSPGWPSVSKIHCNYIKIISKDGKNLYKITINSLFLAQKMKFVL